MIWGELQCLMNSIPQSRGLRCYLLAKKVTVETQPPSSKYLIRFGKSSRLKKVEKISAVYSTNHRKHEKRSWILSILIPYLGTTLASIETNSTKRKTSGYNYRNPIGHPGCVTKWWNSHYPHMPFKTQNAVISQYLQVRLVNFSIFYAI